MEGEGCAPRVGGVLVEGSGGEFSRRGMHPDIVTVLQNAAPMSGKIWKYSPMLVSFPSPVGDTKGDPSKGCPLGFDGFDSSTGFDAFDGFDSCHCFFTFAL